MLVEWPEIGSMFCGGRFYRRDFTIWNERTTPASHHGENTCAP
ncbi:MAG: hypothetical protein CM15mP55_2200 [Hyphomicrobiales bacterium]|nr:MAG: hypothetical protein CM15mP55_2200 [Hyphomicrobiales bacterium]